MSQQIKLEKAKQLIVKHLNKLKSSDVDSNRLHIIDTDQFDIVLVIALMLKKFFFINLILYSNKINSIISKRQLEKKFMSKKYFHLIQIIF